MDVLRTQLENICLSKRSFECIRKGGTLNADVEIGRGSTLWVQLGNISQHVGATLISIKRPDTKKATKLHRPSGEELMNLAGSQKFNVLTWFLVVMELIGFFPQLTHKAEETLLKLSAVYAEYYQS